MHGQAVVVNEEIMLVFGGMIRRDRSFVDLTQEDGDDLDIYNYCEDYERINNKPLPYLLRTCGEELMADLWMYHVKTNMWTYVKPAANEDLYLYVKIPYSRYDHASTYAELDDLDTFMADGETFLRRKYLYIYGGFSFDCETACLDLWRYEIPYGPIALYPKKETLPWHNRGNHWSLVIEDANYSPGPRIRA